MLITLRHARQGCSQKQTCMHAQNSDIYSTQAKDQPVKIREACLPVPKLYKDTLGFSYPSVNKIELNVKTSRDISGEKSFFTMNVTTRSVYIWKCMFALCVSAAFEVWLWDSVADSMAVFAHVCECQHSRVCAQANRGHREAACLNTFPLHTPQGTFATANPLHKRTCLYN